MARRVATVVAVVAAAAVALMLAGCGSGATNDPVAWAESVCKKIEPEVAKLQKTPDMDVTDLAKTKDALVPYLGDLANAINSMSTGLTEAGAPPVDGGADLVKRTVEAMDKAKQAVERAQDKLEAADPADSTAFQQALTDMGSEMSALSEVSDPTKELDSNATLKDAFAKAETCKKIEALS